MKKILKYLIIGIVGLAILGAIFGDKKDKPKEEPTKQEEVKKEADIIDFTKKDEEKPIEETSTDKNTIELNKTISFDKFDITVTKFEKVKDHNKKPALKITYNWTNKGDKATMPFITLGFKGFQDGVQTDSSPFTTEIDYGIAQKEIKPGATIENCQAGVGITDETKPLELELEESFSFSNETYKITIDLNNLK